MNELQTTQNKQLISNDFSSEKIALIKNTVAKDATDIELQFFVEQCKRTGLDPVTKQIYFIKDKNGKVNIQTSIDGLRLIAERSDKYEGQTPPLWCGSDGVWKDVWLSSNPPSACKIGVLKNGFKEPLIAVAIFNEYNAKNFIWNNKPTLMIAKVAEALALRKAFPNDMSGIYSEDEYTPETDDTEKKQTKQVTSVTAIKPALAVVEQNCQNAVIPEPTGALNFDDHSTMPEPVNAPLIQSSNASMLANPEYIIPMGKNYKGMMIKDVDADQLEGFGVWLINDCYAKQKPVMGLALEFVDNVQAFLNIDLYKIAEKKRQKQ
jgi:phage recombination protein Bet